MEDLKNQRLYFSQAISHNGSADDCEEGEAFRTDNEWKRQLDVLGLQQGDDSSSVSESFFSQGDQFTRSCYFISCWSYCKAAATEFARWHPSDMSIVSISEADLANAFVNSINHWNSLQPGKCDMIGEDDPLYLKWEPRSIAYALGEVAYTELDSLQEILPFGLSRAMRLPNHSQSEQEWRLSLDLSHVPSSYSTKSLIKSGLMPAELGAVTAPRDVRDKGTPKVDRELEPMIKFTGYDDSSPEKGLWLMNCDLSSCSSFHLEKL